MPETANLSAHLGQAQRWGQVSTDPRSVCRAKLKACDVWRLLLQGGFRKCYQTCRHRRWHWVTGAAPEGVWLAARGWCVQGHPSATYWMPPALLRADRTHRLNTRLWEVEMSPPFFCEMGQASFLLMFFYNTHQQKTWRHISNKWSSMTSVSHAVRSSSGSTDLSAWYQGFSPLAPYLRASCERYSSSCQKERKRV